jgi:DNA-binding CsgD family transcriptional regulator
MPDELFSYDVFLSHSSKDKAVVRPLAERLREDGVKVWFDEWVLKPGDSIPAKIEEGLEHSRVLVLCMSAHAFGSDWAQLESGTFRFRDPLNKERRFLPLRLDAAAIKGSLAQFLYINWLQEVREQEYAKLLDACRAAIKQPQPTTKPGWLLEIISLERVTSPRSIKLTPSGFSGLKTRLPLPPVYAFNAEGSRVICTSRDGSKLCLWDLKSGNCIKMLRHGKRIRHIEWSKDESRVLLFEEDDKVRLLNVGQDRLLVDYSKTSISKRQMDCFRLLACGFSSREIQQRLGLWVLTAETHLLELRARLGFKRRDELRRYVTTFYSGHSRSTFPPIRMHPRWACSLAWKIEKDRALSRKAE